MNDVVVIKAGEIVHFPVLSNHPLSKYQEYIDVAQHPKLSELAVIKAKLQTIPSMTTPNIISAVNGILASANAGSILKLSFPDITVEQGATMVLNGPISTMTAGNVTVLGEIVFFGSLNLTCASLGRVAAPVITAVNVRTGVNPSGPPVGSTLGGALVIVRGAGFTNATAVMFGKTPASSFNVTSGSSIEAWAPPSNAGKVDISVVAYGILSSAASAADVFTYEYLPGLAGFALAQDYIWTGESITGTITLNELAPIGGAIVGLAITGAPGVSIPPTVSVQAGARSATFPITASVTATGEAQITATAPDGTQRTVSANVFPGQLFVIWSPELLVQDDVGRATILIRTPAPPGGANITLRSNNLGAATIPEAVPLASGSDSATFSVTAHKVSTLQYVHVTATYLGVQFNTNFIVAPSQPGPGQHLPIPGQIPVEPN